jgi:membrane-bound lytic murein transglycosylase B
MKRLLLRATCCALPLIAVALHAAEPVLDVTRSDVRSFVTDVARRNHLRRRELYAVLRDARPQPRILEAIQRPAEKSLAWWEYRQRFITAERIEGGVALWQAQRDALTRIAAQSGVPAEYLIAITGVETFYGRVTGKYRVLDALTTLGFDYPPRSEFFRKELEQYLLMTREEGLDPRTLLGSYAGAMGIPQFMPSSFRRYAVDGSDDGRRNLWEAGPDVFASIANYFRGFGWIPGQPVLAEASNAAAPDDPAVVPRLELGETLAQIRARGYETNASLSPETPAMLVPAALECGVSWRIGFQNFYTITRYNRSTLYAMAVHELAQAILARYREVTAPAP